MLENLLPIKYRVEIYEDSLIDDPIMAYDSSTPFQSFHAGDYIESIESKTQTDMTDKIMQVVTVHHLLCRIEGSHISHSLNICVKVVPR